MTLDNSITMLVQVQPLRCRADSIIPTDWRGNPAGKAGSDGGNLATQRESLLAGAYEERTAKTLKTIVTFKQGNGLTHCESQKCMETWVLRNFLRPQLHYPSRWIVSFSRLDQWLLGTWKPLVSSQR
jgi:hypothetical protein